MSNMYNILTNNLTHLGLIDKDYSLEFPSFFMKVADTAVFRLLLVNKVISVEKSRKMALFSRLSNEKIWKLKL